MGQAAKWTSASSPQAAFHNKARQTPEAMPETTAQPGLCSSLQQGCGRHGAQTSNNPAKEATAQARGSLDNKEKSSGKASFGLAQQGLVPGNLSKELVQGTS